MKNLTTLHLFYIAISLVTLTSCGSNLRATPIVSEVNESFVNDWIDQGLIEYTPLNVIEIEKAVAAKNDLMLQDFKEVHFLKGAKIDVSNACNNNANGCAYVDLDVVIITDYYKDLCVLVAHELTHIALFKATKDAYSNHKNIQFDETFDLCSKIQEQEATQ